MRARVGVVAAGAVALTAMLATGCKPDTVELGFRPAPGATFRYDVTTSSSSTTTLEGAAPEDNRDEADLEVRQEVLEATADGARVAVTLTVPGVGEQQAVVKLDRVAQLTSVETVEGIPGTALGPLGLSELFPPAAGAPPAHPLRPGDRWVIADSVQLVGMAAPVQLSGEGRLVALAVVDGRRTATIRSTYELPVDATTANAEGTRSLRGTQQTEVEAVYDLADGSVLRLTAVTTGSVILELSPPSGSTARPVQGTLVYEIRSETLRLPDA